MKFNTLFEDQFCTCCCNREGTHILTSLIHVHLYYPASTMDYVSAMFKWKQYSILYDAREPYAAVAEVLARRGNYTVLSQNPVHGDMPDDEVKQIYGQIRKYSRSK